MKKALALTMLALVSLHMSSGVHAQSGIRGMQSSSGTNAEEPTTQVLSNSLTYNDTNKTTRFTGDVIMTRGPLTLTADQLDLTEDAEGHQFGTATIHGDKRVYIRQENPDKFEVLVGLGDRAEYDGKAETFDLVDRARLVRYICGKPLDSIAGARVRYYQKTDTYVALGGATSDNANGRVRSVAQPRARIDAAIQECQRLKASGATIPEVPVTQ